MNFREIEKLIQAEYISAYPGGHMGSTIARFRRKSDGVILVVKFADCRDEGAMIDINGNIRGYQKMKELGYGALVPLKLSEVEVEGEKALVMEDLGSSMRKENGGLKDYERFWSFFKKIISKTVKQSGGEISMSLFVTEVLYYIKIFFHGDVGSVLQKIKDHNWDHRWGNQSLTLLDFTPDNVFLMENRLAFIDPWYQETYLGHPAVSIGQFATLMCIYDMKDCMQGFKLLKQRCLQEMTGILQCDIESVETAFKLGMTLQYVLSSFVRQNTEPNRSVEFQKKASEIWN